MSRRTFLQVAGVAAAGGGLGLLVPRPAYAGPAVQRPISDFVDAQGTTSFFHDPPGIPDYIGWSTPLADPPVLFGLVDYAGLANAFLSDLVGTDFGTTTEGNVTEQPLNSGNARVTVELHTKNALSWASELDFSLDNPFKDSPLLFGYQAVEIADDPALVPALGHSHLFLIFDITEPGAPLPDIVAAFILGLETTAVGLTYVAFRARATGALRAAFGVAEGTRGQCVITQTGLLMTSFMGATADAFPAETVDVRALDG
ncbi:MAG: twin-arginine translocation signal domain-containing protein [Planctomycetes bacterium]|nr:twin-arginine translocation signal domain-containing protein [Planctomycetota bacterium]